MASWIKVICCLSSGWRKDFIFFPLHVLWMPHIIVFFQNFLKCTLHLFTLGIYFFHILFVQLILVIIKSNWHMKRIGCWMLTTWRVYNVCVYHPASSWSTWKFQEFHYVFVILLLFILSSMTYRSLVLRFECEEWKRIKEKRKSLSKIICVCLKFYSSYVSPISATPKPNKLNTDSIDLRSCHMQDDTVINSSTNTIWFSS